MDPEDYIEPVEGDYGENNFGGEGEPEPAGRYADEEPVFGPASEPDDGKTDE